MMPVKIYNVPNGVDFWNEDHSKIKKFYIKTNQYEIVGFIKSSDMIYARNIKTGNVIYMAHNEIANYINTLKKWHADGPIPKMNWFNINAGAHMIISSANEIKMLKIEIITDK